jgi:hypothetical protein
MTVAWATEQMRLNIASRLSETAILTNSLGPATALT